MWGVAWWQGAGGRTGRGLPCSRSKEGIGTRLFTMRCIELRFDDMVVLSKPLAMLVRL